MVKTLFFRALWAILPRLPLPLTESVADLIGRIVALLRVPSVRQMETNFRKLSGRTPTRREMMDAVASYFRCFAEQFALTGWSDEQLRTSTVYVNIAELQELMEDGPVVLALTHSGNWDLAAAWFCQSYGRIVTVAERLHPPEIFDQYVRFRSGFGVEIIGVSKGEKVFNTLVEKTRDRSVIVPLLADRDISGTGVEVLLGTEKALVAAGPAALALQLDRPLIAGHMVYRRSGRRWVLHLNFTAPIVPPARVPEETAVETLTKAWVAAVEPLMIEGIVDWHMMQKLYLTDLDEDRLVRARQRHRQIIDKTERK